jgi:hypothetical protein
LPFSFWYIPYNSYAFDRNKFGIVDTSEVLIQGRYFRSLTHEPVFLPATYQLVEFLAAHGTELTIFTFDGYQIALDIRFYYRLPKDGLASLYSKYSMNYQNAIISQAKLVIKDLAGTSSSSKDAIISGSISLQQYIIDRKNIQYNFALATSKRLYDTIGIEVPVKYFQLLTIHIPQNMVTQYLNTVVQKQDNLIQENQQIVAQIMAETDTMVSRINALTNYTVEYAKTRANQLVVQSQSVSNNIVISKRSEAIENIFDTLDIKDKASRQKFLKYSAILETVSPNILVGVNANTLIFGK